MRKCAIIAGVLLTSIATPTAAAPQSGYVAINARVPTVCRVDIAFDKSARLRTGVNQLGVTTELCNNVEGYRIILGHPAGITGAAILLDGKRISIEPSAQQTVILDSSHPAYAQRQLAIELTSPVDLGTMTMYAEPRGAVF